MQLPRAVALRRLPGLPGGARNAARRAVGGLVQPSGRERPGRPHGNRAASRSRAGRCWNCCWPRPRIRASWPSSPPSWASTSTPVPAGRRRQVHPLRAVHPGLQRDDGPRGDQPVRPRGRARSPHGLRRADQPVPGVRGLRVRLPHGGRRPGHDHRRGGCSRTSRASTSTSAPGRASTWPIPRPRRACR